MIGLTIWQNATFLRYIRTILPVFNFSTTLYRIWHLHKQITGLLLKVLHLSMTNIFAWMRKRFPILVSDVCHVFKTVGERSSPSQYHHFIFLSVIRKLFWVYYQQGGITLPERISWMINGIGFTSMFTADVLNVITHRKNEVLDSIFVTTVFTFDKV